MRARHGVKLVLALLVPATTARAQQDARLQVARLFAPWAESQIPGCAVGVVLRGTVAHRAGYGLANLEHAVPISPSTRFDLASQSKQFTAMAVLHLAQDGRLDLRAPIARFVPELERHGDSISVYDLLYHTSGLRDYPWLLEMAGLRRTDFYDDDEALAILTRQSGLTGAPGTAFTYSNSNYWLLGQIVERVSGQSLANYTRSVLFEPLGMSHTGFRDDPGQVVRDRAQGYVSGVTGYRILEGQAATVGDGGIYSSIDDLVTWELAYMNPDRHGELPFARAAVAGTLSTGQFTDYGAGVWLGEHRGDPIVEHGGGFLGFRSHVLRVPNRAFAVVILCNLRGIATGGLARAIADIYLYPDSIEPSSAAPVPAPPARPVPNPNRVVGVYRESEHGILLQVQAGPAGIQGVLDWRDTFALSPVTKERFDVTASPGQYFLFHGSERHADTAEYRVEGRTTRLQFVAVRPMSPEALRRSFAGDYASADLGVTYDVTVEEGALWLRLGHGARRRMHMRPLARAGTDLFIARDEELVIEFARDGDARTVSMTIRVPNDPHVLRFVRH